MKQTICYLLCLVMLCGLLVSCTENGAGASDDSSGESVPSASNGTESYVDPGATSKGDTEEDPKDSLFIVEPICYDPSLIPTDKYERLYFYEALYGLSDDELSEKLDEQYTIPALISAEILSIGMSYEQVQQYLCPFRYGSISLCSLYRKGMPMVCQFFVDCRGKFVVVEYDLDEKIKKITVYDEVKYAGTFEDVRQMKIGTDVHGVIEQLGFPRFVNSNIFFGFLIDDGEEDVACVNGWYFTDAFDNTMRLGLNLIYGRNAETVEGLPSETFTRESQTTDECDPQT